MSSDNGKIQITDSNGVLIDSTHPLYCQLVAGVAIAATVKLENPAGTSLMGDTTVPVYVGAGISSIADGALITEGLKADTAITDATTSNTKMSFLKGLVKIFFDIWNATAHSIRTTLTNSSGTEIGIVTTPVVVSLAAGATTQTTGQVTINTTVGGVLIKALNTSRREILVQNTGAVDVWISNTGVTITTGFKLPAGASYTDDKYSGALYGITSSSSSVVAFRELT